MEKADFHRPIDALNLHSIFCLRFERIINNDYTILFQNGWFQLDKSQEAFIRRGQKVEIYKHFDGTIDIKRNGDRIVFKRITKQKTKMQQAKRNEDRRGMNTPYRKPSASHPWHRLANKPDISTELKRGHF